MPERSAPNTLAFPPAESEIRASYDTAEPVPAVTAAALDPVMESDHAASARVPPSSRLPPPAPTEPGVVHVYRSDLAAVRALVLQQGRAAGLTEGRANDLVLAVSEVAANTLRHTDSAGRLVIWRRGNEVLCEVQDEGTISDPQAGRLRPGPEADGGHGLWLVYQVCDAVELRSDETGTTIRMHMRIDRPEQTGDQRPATGG